MKLNKSALNNIRLLKSKIGFHIDDSESGIITYLNPYSYLYYRKNRHLFSQFDCFGIDGELLVKLLNIFVLGKGAKLSRCSFDMTSKAPLVFKKCIKENKSILFVGSTQASIEDFIGVISKKYVNLNILGYRNGYFDNEEQRDNYILEIINKNPDYVVIGMGSPYQEKFLVRLKNMGYNGIGHTCGGFIHQTAKSLKYYPSWIDRSNLRWAYRIWDEPVLFKRYFFRYPLSVFLFLKDVWTYHFTEN